MGVIPKAGWAGLKKKWPGAHRAISAYTTSNDEMQAMQVAVEREGSTIQFVVDRWIAANEARWRSWIAK